MRLSLVTSALVAVLVGCGGTLALLVAAASATGATQAQTASWVTGLCLATAFSSIVLSLRHRIPIVGAWSTPGAALLAAAAVPIGMPAAVGAFIVTGLLILATAALKPLGDLVARIPTPVAAAMLAGVLLRFVLAVFESAQASPLLVLPLVALFLVARLASPVGAVLIVLAAGIGLAFGLGRVGPMPANVAFTELTFIAPVFDPAVLVGVAVPLYLVTMASQNLPGFAVLRAAGYSAPVRPILLSTGGASILTAFLGAHTSNLAAITASLCTGPDAHPDPAERWKGGVVYGLLYVALAGFGASLVALFTALPAELVKTVAGLALLGPLVGALGGALAAEKTRFAAALTLAVTASGVSLAGVGSAFWGLAAGLLVVGLETAWTRLRP